MKVLVTGGSGYIGSHTVVELLSAGHTVEVLDNLSNSDGSALRGVEDITGTRVRLHNADVTDRSSLDRVLEKGSFDACMHFAGLKSVNESIADPLRYFETNVQGSLSLIQALRTAGVKRLLFSSSATVYGTPAALPLIEASTTGGQLSNPYGRTKWMVEQILEDVAFAIPEFEICVLRYFNPVGAHPSAKIGEDPVGEAGNLMPHISRVAAGSEARVQIFGDDYDTPDGSGVRDYIHVVDVALGHVAALSLLQPGIRTYNLSTGRPVSVLQLIEEFTKATGRNIASEIVSRRPGDVPSCYASAEKAFAELGWKAERTLGDACIDAWRWQLHSAKMSSSVLGTT